MLLIDHQVGTMGWVGSASLEEIKMNTIALARAADAVNPNFQYGRPSARAFI